MGLGKAWPEFSDSSNTSSSQQANNEGPLALEKGDISLALDQLYCITHIIKRSGKKHRFIRADREVLSRENDEEYIQFKQHLEFMILLGQQDIPSESWKTKDCGELFCHVTMPSELTPVHHALVKANMVRRNRIRHATQHLVEHRKANDAAIKLSATEQNPDTGDDMPIVGGTSGTNILQGLRGEDTSIQQDHQPAAPSVVDQAVPKVEPLVKAPMTATEIDTIPFMSSKGAANRKDKGTAITKITRISEQQDFPPCPAKLGTFQCPYCAQALSGDYTNSSQWRYGYNPFFL